MGNRLRTASAWRWILIPLLLAAGACNRSDQGPSAEGPPAISVTVVEAKTSLFEDRVEALGTAHARDAVEITSSVTETIEAIHFEDGQQVEKGALLVTLTQNAEQAQLAVARANLAEQEREVRRLEKLVGTRAAPQNELDERRTLRTIAQQQILQAEAGLRDRTIRAPFAGVLGLRHVSVGALVEPGTLITTLDDLSEIKLDFSVPTRVLAAARVGTPIVATSAALGQRSFEGVIAAVDTRINPRDRSLQVRARIPNPDGVIQPGLLMHVELVASQRQALLIPEGALIPLQEAQFVLVVDPVRENLVERRRVEIGARKPGVVEIRNGLSEGELVIVEGLTVVRPGEHVSIRSKSETAKQGA